MTLDGGEAVIFALRHPNGLLAPGPRVYPRGLQESELYAVSGEEEPVSGAALMRLGVDAGLEGDFASATIRLQAVGSAEE